MGTASVDDKLNVMELSRCWKTRDLVIGATSTGNLAYCWGVISSNDNPYGYTLLPVAVAGGLKIRQVDEGGRGACGVTTANRAYCWSGDLTPSPLPAPE